MKAAFLTLLFFSFSSFASELAYVKTDSPRDTMETFMKAMNDYREGLEKRDPKLQQRIEDAIRCFAEKDDKVILSRREKELAAVFLKEVIDRVILIDLSLVPEKPEKNRWRLKNTEIVLRPMSQGERQGEWLFTEGTWKRAQQFYQRVSHLPYLQGALGAGYDKPWMEEYLPYWSRGETLNLKNWQWLGLLLGLIMGLILKFILQIVLSGIWHLTTSPKFVWKRKFLQALEKPLALLAASAFWFTWAINLQLKGLAFSVVDGLIQIVFGISIVWAAYKAVSVIAKYLVEMTKKTESTLDDQLVPFAEKTLKLTIVLLGALMILQNLGFNVFSLLAGLGLGGLAFALAAQDTAANLFGSIMILIDQPFKVGDWVVVDGVEGSVEEIGFRSTRIRTFYRSLVTVPNAVVAKAKIDNMTERNLRRARTVLDIAYETPRERIVDFVAGIKKILESSQNVSKESYQVSFNSYASSSLQVFVNFYIETQSWDEELAIKQNVFIEVHKLAEELQVDFAYPTQTLYMKGELQAPQ